MDHDQLFKAVLTAQFAPFLALFFPQEAAQLDLAHVHFVDKQLFADPPSGVAREVDLLAEVPLRPPTAADIAGRVATLDAPEPTEAAAVAGADAGRALVAIHIEVQAQRDPSFVWRELEYYALLRRVRSLPIIPIALFPLVDVLGHQQGQGRGRRPVEGYEMVTQQDAALGHPLLSFSFLAVTLRMLDAAVYLGRPQALAGALAALMRQPASMSASQYKLACLRRIIEGTEVAREEERKLLVNVVESYLPLAGQEAEAFERLLDEPEQQGVRQSMKTWLEQHEEIGEARGAVRVKQDDILRVLELRFRTVPAPVVERVRHLDDMAALDALLERAVTAATLADTGLV